MSDIYNILSKYFVGETSKEEEQLVQQFKDNKPEEYQALKAFWTKKGVKITEFDTSKAWQKVTEKAGSKRPVPMYRYLKVAASVAAVFLLLTFGYRFYNNTDNLSSKMVEITAQSQNHEVKLEDGSIVYLNGDASLSFPEKFRSDQRVVTLKGQAFFEVAKDATRPFIIHTNHSDVEVLGTSFNINTQAAQTEIAVATGKVKVSSLSTNESAILTPDQSALINQTFMEVSSTKNINYRAWKTGVFKFKQAPISQVVAELNSYYGEKFVLITKDSNCLLNTTFNQHELQEIVEIIQLSCDLKLKLKNGNYELH